MRKTSLEFPLIGLIAATRGMLGAGIGLLVSERVPAKRRRMIGTILTAVGALSTIPLVIRVIQGRQTTPLATA